MINLLMISFVELISVHDTLCTADFKYCIIQFVPYQHPPQQGEFHPPWLFPSKCKMMVSICSAADRCFVIFTCLMHWLK